MTNFDFLKSEPRFDSFANAAISAEKILPIDTSAAAVQCRSAMEQAIKFMYSVDSFLEKPWSDKLVALMGADTFRALIGNDLYYQLDFIRKVGNSAAHGGRAISRDQAVLCLRNLFVFLDYVAYCYGSDKTTDRAFDPTLLTTAQENAAPQAVRHFPLASKTKSVVSWALADAKLGLAVSTPSPVSLVHEIAAKFLPHGLMLLIWEGLRRL